MQYAQHLCGIWTLDIDKCHELRISLYVDSNQKEVKFIDEMCFDSFDDLKGKKVDREMGII